MESPPTMARFCPECFQVYPDDVDLCPKDQMATVVLPTEESLLGRVVDGKYEILEKLGRGGMGTVYHARQKLIGRDVAIKVLRPDFSRQPGGILRFFTEARAVGQMRSRNCVMLFDFGLSPEGLLYYTMELLTGRTLAALIKQGPLDVDRASQIGIDICMAIEEAHRRGIVHRDLKPENVMLVRDTAGSHAKVLDFGIARLLTQEQGGTVTQPGVTFGTPNYMSPEQAEGLPVGSAADIYSLGIILYELVVGEPPFRDASPVRTLVRHATERPQRLCRVLPNGGIPDSFDSLVDQMLRKAPEDRPVSATEVRKTLERVRLEFLSDGDARKRMADSDRKSDQARIQLEKELARVAQEAFADTVPNPDETLPLDARKPVVLPPATEPDKGVPAHEPGESRLARTVPDEGLETPNSSETADDDADLRRMMGGRKRLWGWVIAVFVVMSLGFLAVSVWRSLSQVQPPEETIGTSAAEVAKPESDVGDLLEGARASRSFGAANDVANALSDVEQESMAAPQDVSTMEGRAADGQPMEVSREEPSGDVTQGRGNDDGGGELDSSDSLGAGDAPRPEPSPGWSKAIKMPDRPYKDRVIHVPTETLPVEQASDGSLQTRRAASPRLSDEAESSRGVLEPMASEPEQAVVLRMQGESLMKKGDFEKAQAVFQEAIRLGGNRTTLQPLLDACMKRTAR